MRCCGGKKLFSTCLLSHLDGVKEHLGARRWMLCTNGLMGYSCLFIGTVGAGVEGGSTARFRALLRRHSLAVPRTFHLATPTFCVSSGRSRIDFVATPPSVQFWRIVVNVTDGRRVQLIPAAGSRDHMPLTLDLVTNGMRHCPDPTRGRWDHEKIEDMLSDPVARLTFFKEFETQIRNSSIVGRAATDATPDDAWENLVQLIQETDGPYFHQGAPRPTRPLALERRRLLLELGTARRLTGTSGDQRVL